MAAYFFSFLLAFPASPRLPCLGGRVREQIMIPGALNGGVSMTSIGMSLTAMPNT